MFSLLRRLIARARRDTDQALMRRRRLPSCEHDPDGECDACYFNRTADSW